MSLNAERHPPPVPERVRSACAWVVERARFVAIDRAALPGYARALPPADGEPPQAAHTEEGPLDGETVDAERPGDERADAAPAGDEPAGHDRERRSALLICQDAVNFGSGWWPTIRKRPGHSGYLTIAAALHDRFDEAPWSPAELAQLTPEIVARVLGQDPVHPLMDLYAAALRDVGEHVLADHHGRFAHLLDAAAGSAPALVDRLAGWSAFADTSTYETREVPFFKRAQIAAADVARARLAPLSGVERLTAFADNLVPHVLRLDAILLLDPALAARIDAGQLLTHGSPEEVELRACAVHAVELLSGALDGRLCPAQVDELLWRRGREPRYKAVERPRCRTTAY
jgi:Potential Queuosine, Q, salvage protein family